MKNKTDITIILDRSGSMDSVKDDTIGGFKELKIENNNTYLYVAWKRLALKNINETHELDERINQIEKYLGQLPAEDKLKWLGEYPIEMQKYGYIDPTIRISTVIDFLYALLLKTVHYRQETLCRASPTNKRCVACSSIRQTFCLSDFLLHSYQV